MAWADYIGMLKLFNFVCRLSVSVFVCDIHTILLPMTWLPPCSGNNHRSHKRSPPNSKTQAGFLQVYADLFTKCSTSELSWRWFECRLAARQWRRPRDQVEQNWMNLDWELVTKVYRSVSRLLEANWCFSYFAWAQVEGPLAERTLCFKFIMRFGF